MKINAAARPKTKKTQIGMRQPGPTLK